MLHEMTQVCLDVQQALMEATQLPVHLVDERYSSVVLPNATQTNARGQTRAKPQDNLAAAVILQQYLDMSLNISHVPNHVVTLFAANPPKFIHTCTCIS